MDKRKLSKIPRPCATQRMINDAKQLESMNHMVTAELIEDKKILLLNFFRIKTWLAEIQKQSLGHFCHMRIISHRI